MQEISGLAKELLVSEEGYIHGVSSFALGVPSHFLSTCSYINQKPLLLHRAFCKITLIITPTNALT